MNELGKYISKMRQERNLTQKELADKMHLHVTTISKWENGNSIPNLNYFEDLAKALDITTTELFECRENNSSNDKSSTRIISNSSNEIVNSDKRNYDDKNEENASNTISSAPICRNNKNSNKGWLKYLTIILLSTSVIIVIIGMFVYKKYFAEPEILVVDEFLLTDTDYFGYNSIYYIIVEYDGNMTAKYAQDYRKSVQIRFEEEYSKADLLMVLFYDDYIDVGSIHSPDFELVLYPNMVSK